MKKNCKTILVLCFTFLLTLWYCLPVQAGGGDDLRAKAQNPVSSMYSLPLKFTVDFNAPNGSAYFMNVNPVIPVTVLGGWNFINRALIPLVVSVDGYIGGPLEFFFSSPSGVPMAAWFVSCVILPETVIGMVSTRPLLSPLLIII